jgi:SAM-dependent methyltransferase
MNSSAEQGRQPEPRAGIVTPYILDNAGSEAADRFPALSTSFDPGTIHHLEQLDIKPGARCLEVGGGGGSIAAWMAARVGSMGHVVVTDLDTRYLEGLELPHTEIRRHDIAVDPLPSGTFDVVHARLVLVHVPQRDRALARMAAAVRPGGWLLVEEFDSSVAPDPTLHAGEVLSDTYVAMTRLMTDRGVDRAYGRRLYGSLQALGFEDIRAEGRTFMWPTGSPGPSLMRANYAQLRDAMIGGGYVSAAQYERDVAGLADPAFLMPSPILWSVWGRAPEEFRNSAAVPSW